MTDYKQAKTVVNTLNINSETTVKVNVANTFRKYLRDFSNEKKFSTKKNKEGLKVTRLK